jgi:TDG/mug DNA glycosylase family protein
MRLPSLDHKLPDLLAPDLRVVFVGTAAGRRSAAVGHYYAGRGNRFWRTLHEIGLTPRCFEPKEFRKLLELGVGLTDMSKLGSGMDRQIAKHEFDAARFEVNVRRYRPRAIAFTSKKAASIWLGKSATRAIAYGRRPPTAPDFPEVFVLPSPSGAARSYWSITPWQELAAWYRATAPPRCRGSSFRVVWCHDHHPKDRQSPRPAARVGEGVRRSGHADAR